MTEETLCDVTSLYPSVMYRVHTLPIGEHTKAVLDRRFKPIIKVEQQNNKQLEALKEEK